ncbi:unnamed protein product, partial [Protopolystoma xenopodis]
MWISLLSGCQEEGGDIDQSFLSTWTEPATSRRYLGPPKARIFAPTLLSTLDMFYAPFERNVPPMLTDLIRIEVDAAECSG